MHINDKKLSDLLKNNPNIIPINQSLDINLIKPLSHEEIMQLKLKPVENIIHPWLPSQGIAFIYAASGVGKTLFALNTAYAIAGGGSFLKFKAPKPRRVLYIDGEMSLTVMQSRYLKTVSQQSVLYDPTNFYLLNHEAIRPHKLPKICSPEGQEFYNKLIQQENIEVIIFDNLSTLSNIDENVAEQWNVIQDWLIYLRSEGKSSIIVHHAGKDKRGYRGTSKMIDIADTAISLQDLSKEELETEIINSKKFKICYHKNRSFGGKDALPFNALVTDDGWHTESNELSNLEHVVDGIKNKLTHQAIANEMGVTRQYVSKLVKKAKLSGMLREE